MEEKTKKKLKVFGLIVCMMIVIYSVLFVVLGSEPVESKTFSGNLVSIKKYPQGPRYDVVLFFNNSGIIEYLVINEYKTGLMVELENCIGVNVTIWYEYHPFKDINRAVDYEVLD